MAITAAQLIAEVKVEGDEQAKQKLDSVSGKVRETGEGFGSMLKGALSFAAGQAVFTAVGDAIGFVRDQITSTIALTEQYQQTQAQTVQVLKSTKDVSGETVQSLNDLADAYGRTTEFSADTVQGGENLLLTFTNIGKSVFPQATQAILDVSQAMGQDLKSSAIQVGKALGDPTTGMTALQRIGVTFSAQEKEQIKTMMAHNDIIGAQKVILHELATEFGGSAAAAGKTFAGQMAELGNTLDEDKVKIGTALLPVLQDLLTKTVEPLIQRFSDWMFKGGGLNDFKQIVTQISDFLTSDLLPGMGQLLNTYVIPLATQMYDLFIKSGWVHDALSTIGQIIGTVGPLVFTLVTDAGNLVGWFQKAGPQGEILKGALIGIGTAIAGIKIAGMIQDFMTFANNTVGIVEKGIAGLIGTDGGTGGFLGMITAIQGATGPKGIGSIAPALEAEEPAAASASAALGAVIEAGIVAGVVAAITAGAHMLTDWLANQKVPGGPLTFNQMQQDIEKVGIRPPISWGPDYNGPTNSTENSQGNGDILPGYPGGPPSKSPAPYKNPNPNPVGRHFAQGGIMSTSGWATMNEDGFEGVQFPGGGSPAYLPAGTRVIPNNQLGNSNANGAMTLIMQVDGYPLAQIVTQYQSGYFRQSLGLVGV